MIVRIANPDCKDCKWYFFSHLSKGNECKKIPIEIKNGICLNYSGKNQYNTIVKCSHGSSDKITPCKYLDVDEGTCMSPEISIEGDCWYLLNCETFKEVKE